MILLHRLVAKVGRFPSALTRSLTISKSGLCCEANKIVLQFKDSCFQEKNSVVMVC
jgi:hypothetical protein